MALAGGDKRVGMRLKRSRLVHIQARKPMRVDGTKVAMAAQANGRVGAFVVVALALTAFAPGLLGGFVFDDFPNIATNPAFAGPIQSWRALWEVTLSSPASSVGRPLAMLTFAADFMAHGLDPFWFKLTNLLLHGFNGLLLWAFIRRLWSTPALAGCFAQANCDPRRASLWFTLCWSVLAIHVSAIFLVVQRMELLAHTFVIWSLLVYVDGRQRMVSGEQGGVVRVAAALVLLPLIGVLAKESAALAPAYAFVLEIFVFRFAAASARARRWLPMAYVLMFLVAAGIFARWMLPTVLDPAGWSGRNFDLSERLWSEARILWLYLRWIFAPDLSAMSLYHDSFVVSRGWLEPPSTALFVFAWLGVIAALAWLARRRSLLGLGIAFYVTGHLLTATVYPLELIFEHRNYTASIGALIAVVPLWLRLRRAGGRARVMASALIVVFLLSQLACTAMRALEWSNPLRHAQAEAARNPTSPRAVYELGRVEYKLSGLDPSHPAFALAVANFRRAAALEGASALPLQALLIAASRSGRGDDPELWRDLQAHVRDRRMDVQTVAAVLGLVHCAGKGECQFPLQQLVGTLIIGVNRERPPAELLVAYGSLALSHLHDRGLAGELFRAAVDAEPRNPVRWFSYGQYLVIDGRLDEAEQAAKTMEDLDRWHRHDSKIAALRALIRQMREKAQPPMPG